MPNVAPSSDGKKVEIQERVVRTQLVQEKNPSLGADLNAESHNIKGVNDVECKTVNGVDLEQKLTDLFGALSKLIKEKADVDHSHEDLTEKMNEVVTLTGSHTIDIESLKMKQAPKPKLDELEGTIGAEQVRGFSDLIEKLNETRKAVNEHKHPSVEKAIDNLNKIVIGLQAHVEQAKKDKAELAKVCADALDTLESRIADLTKKPEDEKPLPVELVCAKYGLVPERANDKSVSKIRAFDHTGKPIAVKVMRGDQELGVGSLVKTDDFLTITPASIVHVWFS